MEISGVLMLCESMPIMNNDVGQKVIAQIKTIASTASTLEELFFFEHQRDDVIAKRKMIVPRFGHSAVSVTTL